MQSVANAELCFFLIILILHGKVAVNGISAFYLPYFTFFYKLQDVFSPLCLSHGINEWRKKDGKNIK